jgi:hypothetical protein
MDGFTVTSIGYRTPSVGRSPELATFALTRVIGPRTLVSVR